MLLSVFLLSCQKKGEEKLNQIFLQKTERFVPTDFHYNLLEIVSDTADIDSPRFLCLFDKNANLVEQIRLYGTVQKSEKNYIIVNKNISGLTGNSNIGNLKIKYEDIKKISKGGGINGEYILDSIKYDLDNKKVQLFYKKSKEWFGEKIYKTEKKTVSISDINFEPQYKKCLTITGWDRKGKYNSTERFYYKDKKMLTKFLMQIEKNGL
jgi:hypothetical protein